ncbi:hypothetical protein ACVIGA_004352 [Bradyrhizobium sp. USDA 3240]
MSSVGGFVPGHVYDGPEIMRQIASGQFFLMSQLLAELHARCSHASLTGKIVDQKGDLDSFSTIFRLLEQSGLPVSLGIAEISRKMLFEQKPCLMSYDFLAPNLYALKESIFAELGTGLYFRMDEDKRSFFENRLLFGDDVAARFPTSSFDIEEGGKCLSLGRPTATVFHMMRVMEVGLKALAKELKIPYAPSWESYIRQIDANITAKHKSKAKKWLEMEPFYRDVLGNLTSIKIAWRNPTMHIVRNYTQDEAEDVLRAVRTFMRRLSERLSQA